MAVDCRHLTDGPADGECMMGEFKTETVKFIWFRENFGGVDYVFRKHIKRDESSVPNKPLIELHHPCYLYW